MLYTFAIAKSEWGMQWGNNEWQCTYHIWNYGTLSLSVSPSKNVNSWYKALLGLTSSDVSPQCGEMFWIFVPCCSWTNFTPQSSIPMPSKVVKQNIYTEYTKEWFTVHAGEQQVKATFRKFSSPLLSQKNRSPSPPQKKHLKDTSGLYCLYLWYQYGPLPAIVTTRIQGLLHV